MAKNTPKPAEVSGPLTLEEAPAGAVDSLPVVAASEPEQLPPAKRFRVHLKAASPLAQNPAVVDAINDAEAWEEFCKLNGISGSDHEREITEVKE